MRMDRRGFIGSILALGMAPALVRASSLMPLRVLRDPFFDSVILSHFDGPVQFSNERLLQSTGMTLGKILVDLIGPEHCDVEAMLRLDAPVGGYVINCTATIHNEILRLQQAYKFQLVAG